MVEEEDQMKTNHVWPLLISINPIWRPISVTILKFLAGPLRTSLSEVMTRELFSLEISWSRQRWECLVILDWWRICVGSAVVIWACAGRLVSCHPKSVGRFNSVLLNSVLLGNFVSLLPTRCLEHIPLTGIVQIHHTCPSFLAQLHEHPHSIYDICRPCHEIWPPGCIWGTTYVLVTDKIPLENSDWSQHTNSTSSTTSSVHHSLAEPPPLFRISVLN